MKIATGVWKFPTVNGHLGINAAWGGGLNHVQYTGL